MPLAATTYHTDLAGLGSFRLDDIGTFAAVPGVEIDVPLSARWSVKPLAYAGLGKEFHGGPSAAIYWAGAKARAALTAGDHGVDVVASLRYAGFTARGEASGDLVPLRVGVEVTRPMRNRTLGDDPLNWYLHVARTHYVDDDAAAAGAPPLTVDDEWELGAAFGKRDARLRLGRLSWDRVGIAVTLDSGGDFSGFRLVFRSLYDR